MLELRALLEMRQAAPLSFSGDGSMLLVASDVPGTQQLFVAPARGGELRQLTDFAEPVVGQFLPDGRILLEMDDGGNERTQLYLLEAEPGAVPEPLVVDPRFNHESPHLGRDGALLVYSTNRRNGVDFDIVARTLADGEERSYEPGGWCWPAGVSPDGRWIVVSRLGDRAGDNDLFLFDPATGDVVHATPHDGEAEYLDPVWLADSSGFFAAANDTGDTFAIRRYDLASREWKTVAESRWDLECFGDAVGRTLLVVANEDGYSTLELCEPSTGALAARFRCPAAASSSIRCSRPTARCSRLGCRGRPSRTTCTSTTSTRAS